MLRVISEIVQKFNSANIKYCHWKSNLNLSEACEGVGDLDLLFDREQYAEVVSILTQHKFKRLESHIDRQFPGVEDFVGLDEETGKLVHLQAHYCLVTGQPMVKNYQFSIEKSILNNLVIDKKTGLHIPKPEVEAIIHVFRTFIKVGFAKVIRKRLYRKMITKAKMELGYLESNFEDEIGDIFDSIFPNLSKHIFISALNAIKIECSGMSWLKERKRVVNEISVYQRRGGVRTSLVWILRRGFLFFSQKILKRTPKRKLSAGGMGIAIVGSDGAGKSTAINKLNHWLGEYLEVSTFHMGKPKKSLLTLFLAYSLALVRKFNPNLSLPQPAESRSQIWPTKFAWLPALLLWSLAKDRLNCFLKARQVISRGGVAIFDRFPIENLSLMEVPQIDLIADISKPLYDRIYRNELAIYRKIVQAELTFVLSIEPELAAERQPGDGREYVIKRATAVQEYLKLNPANVTVINSADSLEIVTTNIRNRVWMAL